jgi:hypothetical protein
MLRLASWLITLTCAETPSHCCIGSELNDIQLTQMFRLKLVPTLLPWHRSSPSFIILERQLLERYVYAL